MRFGSRAFGKDYIEDTIEWISSKEGVVWIWPREGVDEWCNQTGESNSE
ncbi:MAG: hypothetical protein BWY82_03022 [Verrucomicrobia bacterium ADurb.Bin474]|nr:MAG: hypothetical protein BWY82_03022 [Verrucomicrobia bacterium ADurb.Bin474]